MAVLITGATGHLGPQLIAELLKAADFDRVYVAARRLDAIPVADPAVVPIPMDFGPGRPAFSDADVRRVQQDVSVIIHAAADTRFAAPLDELRPTNVDATLAVCDIARGCRQLQQLLFVSTACVAGRRTGLIPERIHDDVAGFANTYEQTKWEAEQVVAGAGLPVRVARLSTCAGSHATGYVHRFGALHHLLHWMSRGLVPMVPGTATTPVDVISTDVAAAWLARAAAKPPAGVEVCHVALGERPAPLGELLDFVYSVLDQGSTGRPRHVPRPLLVDEPVFQSFNRMVRLSGDALLTRVQASASAVLPSLLHPKVYETSSAERCWGGQLPHADWRLLLSQVIAFGRAARWGFSPAKEACHA